MNKLEFTNKVLDNLNDSISEDGKVGLAKFIELTNKLYEAINYTHCCKSDSEQLSVAWKALEWVGFTKGEEFTDDDIQEMLNA